MAANLSQLNARIDEVVSEITASRGSLSNRHKRILFAKGGLLEVEAEKLYFHDKISKEQCDALVSRLALIHDDALGLGFIQQNKYLLVFYIIDEVLRIIATWAFLIDASLILVPISMTLNKIFPSANIASKARNLVGFMCTFLSNVEIVIEGLDDETFQTGETSMLAFSHASTMDAFILSQCIPVSMYTIAKSELFLIPFFSLLLSSYGGIAVNRGDIKQAIKALRFSIEKATSGKDKQVGGTALAISPEGTRSARGQLIAFKKGPFYTWEQLQCNVVPFVVFGAYDLYPPGKQMSVPGRVVVRYCPPITLSDLTTPIEHDTDGHKRREEMALLLREGMLATMLDSPTRVGDESPTQSWPSWLVNKVSYTSLIGANVAAGYCMYDYCHSHEISYAVITSVTVGIVLGSSVCVYFYNLYLCRPPSIPGCEPGSPVKAKNSDLELKSNERGGNDGNVDSNGNAKVKTS